MDIDYKIDKQVSLSQFIGLLKRSTLAERRPIDDVCLQGMLANSNLIITAWAGQQLVGIARSITDFHYCCYLSDLAVDVAYQQQGIGKQLQRITQQQLGPKCKLILLAAPSANSYYEPLGFKHHPRCWVLAAD